ncbi:hypothetical protein ACGFLS_09515 [Streptomyces abikoensis]|uniref:hypothetical protein n=1 Tax=Streptomyces abikoensis TaxID=97398 RepID=UPI0037150575
MISVHASGFAGGAVWLLIAAGLAVGDVLAYRRRVTTRAVCRQVVDGPKGIVKHSLERVPLADEGKLVVLRTKGPSVGAGRAVAISYDPKRDHEVFLADRHPRMTDRPAIVAAIGVVQIAVSIAL